MLIDGKVWGKMDTDKLKKTLGKIHPDKELVKQVKLNPAQKNIPKFVKGKSRYRIAYSFAVVCILIAAIGVYDRYMRMASEQKPNIARAGEETQGQTSAGIGEDQSDIEAYTVRKTETLVYEGREVVLLDECSDEDRDTAIIYPKEGEVCYTRSYFLIASLYREQFQGILSNEDEALQRAAAFVYWQGKWNWKLLEASKEAEQTDALIPAAQLEELLKFVNEVCK